MPAMIWPITCGCRMYESNLARILHTTNVIKTCIKNVAKGRLRGSSKRTTIAMNNTTIYSLYIFGKQVPFLMHSSLVLDASKLLNDRIAQRSSFTSC